MRTDPGASFPSAALQRIDGRHHRRRERGQHPPRRGIPRDRRGSVPGRIRPNAEIGCGSPPGAAGRPEGHHLPAPRQDRIPCLLHAGGRQQSLPLRLLGRRRPLLLHPCPAPDLPGPPVRSDPGPDRHPALVASGRRTFAGRAGERTAAGDQCPDRPSGCAGPGNPAPPVCRGRDRHQCGNVQPPARPLLSAVGRLQGVYGKDYQQYGPVRPRIYPHPEGRPDHRRPGGRFRPARRAPGTRSDRAPPLV